MNPMYDPDYCYECSGYGDDWYYSAEIDDLVCACDNCPFCKYYDEDDKMVNRFGKKENN